MSDREIDYDEWLDNNPDVHYCELCGSYTHLVHTKEGDVCDSCRIKFELEIIEKVKVEDYYIIDSEESWDIYE